MKNCFKDWSQSNLQCVNDHNAKFEYKWMKTAGGTDYTNTIEAFWKKKMSKLKTPILEKYSWNVHKTWGAHLQFVKIIMQSLNIKEWKLLELQTVSNIPGVKYIEKYSNTLQLLSLINDYITITGPVEII